MEKITTVLLHVFNRAPFPLLTSPFFSPPLLSLLTLTSPLHLSVWKKCFQVLPWVGVCWPTVVLSRTRCSERPWRRCAYVRPRWGCACHCARCSCPSKVPPRDSAVRGWHHPNAPDGPRYDSAAVWKTQKERHEKPAQVFFFCLHLWPKTALTVDSHSLGDIFLHYHAHTVALCTVV